jgi:dCTP deaminase
VDTPIDLEKAEYYDIEDFWELYRSGPGLLLQPERCYILASRERIRIPPSLAAEMMPVDSLACQISIGSKGYFDPGFGYGDGALEGARAVVTLRSLGVPFLLRHGQPIARFVFEKLRFPSEKVYGTSIGSSYQAQELWLSKHFRRGRKVAPYASGACLAW